MVRPYYYRGFKKNVPCKEELNHLKKIKTNLKEIFKGEDNEIEDFFRVDEKTNAIKTDLTTESFRLGNYKKLITHESPILIQVESILSLLCEYQRKSVNIPYELGFINDPRKLICEYLKNKLIMLANLGISEDSKVKAFNIRCFVDKMGDVFYPNPNLTNLSDSFSFLMIKLSNKMEDLEKRIQGIIESRSAEDILKKIYEISREIIASSVSLIYSVGCTRECQYTHADNFYTEEKENFDLMNLPLFLLCNESANPTFKMLIRRQTSKQLVDNFSLLNPFERDSKEILKKEIMTQIQSELLDEKKTPVLPIYKQFLQLGKFTIVDHILEFCASLYDYIKLSILCKMASENAKNMGDISFYGNGKK